MSDNLLLHGDNLELLRELQDKFIKRIKLVYLDPPYNTGKDFLYYKDRESHKHWLNLMFTKLVLIRELLEENGSIWISIDDTELYSLKHVCDEAFGKDNFVANIIWQKKYTIANDAQWFSNTHDYILVYAKDKSSWRPNKLPRTEEMNARYSNPDDHSKGPWKATPLHAKSGSDSNFSYTFKNGIIFTPPEGTYSRFSRETLQLLEEDNAIWFGKTGKNIPSRKTFLSEINQEGTPCGTIWTHEEVGHNHEAKEEVKPFDKDGIFTTPKPERLLRRIIHLASSENDYVLDAFAGSGTTGAIAHKMNRKWIMMEQGSHIDTIIKPRLDSIGANYVTKN